MALFGIRVKATATAASSTARSSRHLFQAGAICGKPGTPVSGDSASQSRLESRTGRFEWAEVREAQLLTASTTPDVGLVVTIDVGDPKNVHPARKHEVGSSGAVGSRSCLREKVRIQSPIFDSFANKRKHNRRAIQADKFASRYSQRRRAHRIHDCRQRPQIHAPTPASSETQLKSQVPKSRRQCRRVTTGWTIPPATLQTPPACPPRHFVLTTGRVSRPAIRN